MNGTSGVLPYLQKAFGRMQEGIRKRLPKMKKSWLVCWGCVGLSVVIIHSSFVRNRQMAEREIYDMAFQQQDFLTREQFLELQAYVDHVDSDLQAMQALLAITIIVGVAVYGLYKAQRKRMFYEKEHYQLLDEFSDTILMYYYYKTDTMTLTSNLRERFYVSTLQKEGYLKDNHPCMGIKDDDWISIRALLGHPEQGKEIKTIRFSAKKKNGDGYLWCSLQLRFVFENGEAVAAIGKITDISNQKILEEKLIKQAQIDGLTGTYNKGAVKQKVAELLRLQYFGYLIMMDVDNFKQINDIYGHSTGDEILIDIGSVLREVFRKEDVVGRIGGDEFVVFIGGDKSRVFSIERRAQLILERISEVQDKENVEVTISIGIAFCPEDGKTYEALYRAADRAMYHAKRKGKNQYCFAHDIGEAYMANN